MRTLGLSRSGSPVLQGSFATKDVSCVAERMGSGSLRSGFYVVAYIRVPVSRLLKT